MTNVQLPEIPKKTRQQWSMSSLPRPCIQDSHNLSAVDPAGFSFCRSSIRIMCSNHPIANVARLRLLANM